MKALKIIGLSLLGLIVIVLILMFVMPTKYKMERSIVINAPKEVVFNNVKFLKNQQKWSPWKDKDTNMKVTIEGTDGSVGSVSKWEGKEVGKGSMTITTIEDLKSLDTKLVFLEPWKMESNAYLRLEDTVGGVKVMWGMYGDSPRPWNVLSLFMSMDASVGKDYELGLSRLKTLSEKEAASDVTGAKAYDIKETTTEPKTYIGIKKEVTWDKLGAFFAENYPKMFAEFHKTKLKTTGPPSGLFYTWDEKNMKTDVAAVAPVANDQKKIGSWEIFKVKGGKTLTVDYYGAYDKTKAAHDQIGAYIKKKNYKFVAPVIDEYITSPMNEKDTTKWLTKISYFVE